MTSPHESCQQHPKLEDRSIWTVRLLVVLLALVGYQVFFQGAAIRDDLTRLEGRVTALEHKVEQLEAD